MESIQGQKLYEEIWYTTLHLHRIENQNNSIRLGALSNSFLAKFENVFIPMTMGNFFGNLLHTLKLKLRKNITEIQYRFISTRQLHRKSFLQRQTQH